MFIAIFCIRQYSPRSIAKLHSKTCSKHMRYIAIDTCHSSLAWLTFNCYTGMLSPSLFATGVALEHLFPPVLARQLGTHSTTFNFMYSSIIVDTMHVVAKSAAKSVIRFGRYFCSLSVHGRMIRGTVGVRENIEGSQIKNTPRRITVVTKISSINART